MTIINTGFLLNSKFSLFLLSPPNIFDLALKMKKIKQNKKVLASCLIESLFTFNHVLTIAETLQSKKRHEI